ncbi:RsmD family RNA methyltransferase [Akkermansia muciniphila]|nr:RsmD family RNA methyltransferase [Akkermansia muciniphila]
MKALRNLALTLIVPVLVSSLSAAEKPEIVGEYLPVGKMAEAAAVSVVLDESLQPFMEKIDGVFASLPDKDKKELVSQIVPGQPVPYDERLGWTKDEYAKYLECWKLKQVQEVAPVALGIFASGERNIWDLAAVAQQGPLPMSTLKYDSSTKSWISPNGTLTLKGDVSYDELNVYGAWSGKEWTMEKKTILSSLTETIIAGKTKDGKYAYFVYNMSEKNPDNVAIANQSIVLRVPVTRIAGDPLLEKAKAKAHRGYDVPFISGKTTMRIISGKAGGITLSVPKGEVRPTTDRVREAVFSILNPLMDRADVLDLFAGSGAFGLEALSRGARDARMVDFSRLSCAAARANLVKTGLEGGTVIQGDAVQFVRRELLAGRKYDIIFADPPYCKGPADRDFIVELAEAGVAGLLKGGGVFIAEVQEGWGTGREGAAEIDGLNLVDTRRYGKNMLLFYQLPEK